MNPQDTSPNESHRREHERAAEIAHDIARTGQALSTGEAVNRFGSASAEYIKGYTGVDHETGKQLRDGLKSLSEQGRGIKQKAGVAAEIMSTNRDNAEAIINKQQHRSFRADDRSLQYGTNHQIVDRIRISEEGVVSYSQMKFECSSEALVSNIVKKDGEYAKYLAPKEVCAQQAQVQLDSAQAADARVRLYEEKGDLPKATKFRRVAEAARVRAANHTLIGESEIRIEVPTEQVSVIKAHCRENASRLNAEAAANEVEAEVAERLGNQDKADRLRLKACEQQGEATRNEELQKRVVDSGVSQSDAELAATQPLKTTITSVLKTSHRAGVQGAAYAGVIGACISLLQNTFALARGQKDVAEAAEDAASATAKAAAFGYATAFAGSAIKGVMEHAPGQGLKNLASTTAPALAVNICLSLGSSVRRYVDGHISEAQLLTEVGEKGAGMLSGSMMAALGQLAIPIPGVGAAVGGMIGYTLSSMFYQSALDAAKGAEASRERLQRTLGIQTAARSRIAEEQAALNDFFSRELPMLREETQRLFDALNFAETGQASAQVQAINDFALLLGKSLEFQTQVEFDDFMLSDRQLKL